MNKEYEIQKKKNDAVYDKKMRVFQKALKEANASSICIPYEWPILNTLERRIWVLILHKRGSGGLVDEESGYSWNIDSPVNSGYVLVVDTETGRYVKITAKSKYVGRATPWFAQYLTYSNKIVIQFYTNLLIYDLNLDEMSVKKVGQITDIKGGVDFACENGEGNLVAYTSDRSSLPNLVSLKGKVREIHLPGFSSIKRILGVSCFYEGDKMKIIVFRAIQDDKFEKAGDPTYSLAVFIENGEGDRESYWHFNTILYDSYSPHRVEFHEDPFIQKGFVRLTAYGYAEEGNSLLGQYLIPKNLDQFRDK